VVIDQYYLLWSDCPTKQNVINFNICKIQCFYGVKYGIVLHIITTKLDILRRSYITIKENNIVKRNIKEK